MILSGLDGLYSMGRICARCKEAETKMTVRFNQFVAGRQEGKTTFLVNRAVNKALNGKRVAVVLPNTESARQFAAKCRDALAAKNDITWTYDYDASTIIVSDESDYCNHCDRGTTVNGVIRFIGRPTNDRDQLIGADGEYDEVLVDNAEYLAGDSVSLEDNILNVLYEFLRPGKDIDAFVTITERPLELSGTLNL